MSNEFEREERYIVFKMPDLGNSLKGDEIRRLAREYAEHLEQFVKKPLDYVVVGAGWSEYSPALRVIEVHVTGAQPAPSAPEGWLRAIDEALIVAHIGMANADDTYAQAKSKLDTLIGLHADIATDPAVNGGWKLVPTAESRHPGIHKMLNALHAVDNTPGASEWESYAAFLAATPEAKP